MMLPTSSVTLMISTCSCGNRLLNLSLVTAKLPPMMLADAAVGEDVIDGVDTLMLKRLRIDVTFTADVIV